jgi:hypothetical protein
VGSTSDYHALQVNGRRRLSQGLEFLASYTLSKTLTDNLGYYGSAGVIGGYATNLGVNIDSRASFFAFCVGEAKSLSQLARPDFLYDVNEAGRTVIVRAIRHKLPHRTTE